MTLKQRSLRAKGNGRPPTGVPGHTFRRAMGHFASGVAVVTSLDEAGRPVGTTANAITSLSLDPPLVLVCFERGSNTLHAVRGHGAFAINILAAEHRDLSASFARPGAPATVWERLADRDGETFSPRLHDVLASLDCLVEERIPGGDHEIVIGRVLEVLHSERDRLPLLFYRGEYGSLVRP
jgi:flavin reductase (DIM6/NTAB) family NADH-FMN oxidoreductase RutF